MTWETNTTKLALAVAEFEATLPGFWWSVGQCSLGAHASCAVDGNGPQAFLLANIKVGHPFNNGFHCDTKGGQPHEALINIMQQVLTYMESYK